MHFRCSMWRPLSGAAFFVSEWHYPPSFSEGVPAAFRCDGVEWPENRDAEIAKTR
jgi:hypothetical protein